MPTSASFKVIAKEMTEALEQTYSATTALMAEYAGKIADAVRSHANGGFDFASQVAAARSFSDLVEYSAEHARKQFDASTKQNKELFDAAQRAILGSVVPITTSVSRTVEIITSSQERS